mgnify:CR=1 FL=1
MKETKLLERSSEVRVQLALVRQSGDHVDDAELLELAPLALDLGQHAG